ncbi:phosphoglycerate mutase-like protein [Penicillium argentinense]|uniref:Phosphoglycerate mutase-like protein n=1 Tax=Penicillium argentinense TaxID=1131581 RepID=A0A9W9FG93_9EURO|nr:phosphoglycerate mutase-like protein [Penicillium argentinense]KAJ5099633.1 phosphoglycerate mutase-like protein [Penicillium argentinense]
MPPLLHLVRHAEGYHNLGPQYWKLPDPLLTEAGKRQCWELRESFSAKSTVDLVVTSPMRRAIYTGLGAFNFVFEYHPDRKLIALPSLQELSEFPCDVGSKLEDLQNEVQQQNLPVDLGYVEEGWYIKTGKYKSTLESIRDRAQSTRSWLKARPEKEIVVVTHGGFLHFLTDDWEDGAKYEATGWNNVECRTYEFLSDRGNSGGPDDAELQETMNSRRRRGKLDLPLSPDTQDRLRRGILLDWAKQGYTIGSPTVTENSSPDFQL